MNCWHENFFRSTSLLCLDDKFLHALNNFSCLVVFGQPFMTILVMFKQLFTFSLCLKSFSYYIIFEWRCYLCLHWTVFKQFFLLSHIWMMMLVVFEQLFIFSCVWPAYLLSHVWMTMFVVLEQLIIFSRVWTTFYWVMFACRF